MIPLIAVMTDDDYLWQKIYLTLRAGGGVERVSTFENVLDAVAIYDSRLEYSGTLPEKTVVLGLDLPLPFTYDQLNEALTEIGKNKGKILTRGDRSVYLRGERIALTEVEKALLDALMDAGGEFVSRDELMKRVWHGEADGGVLNVYVHYLRTKIERGEKIIVSSRSQGYKIDEKFI